jgi:hypothetical protein
MLYSAHMSPSAFWYRRYYGCTKSVSVEFGVA